MSTARPPARPPRVRLESAKDAKSLIAKAGGQIARPKATAPPKCCEAPEFSDTDGTHACMNCGTVITESEIVSEVTFGENSNGAAVVQGAFVGENQRHAKTMGPAFRRNGGTTESREQTEQKGKAEINKIAAAVRLNNPSTEDQAFGIYKLAIGINFIQGRRVRTVAAVCLYIACRRKAGNTTLLMDFAAELQMNVWALGDVYKALRKELWFGEPATASGVPAVLEVEPLIDKFAERLEFGDDTRKVATDAVNILRRMKRDWMVEGRQPAGLCGACIIIAARQNNFRRTVREVVYVVKVCDNTIFQRLIEFKRTQAASLSIEQFRDYGHRLKVKGEPPSIYKRREKEERTNERRKRKSSELSEEVNGPPSVGSSSSPAVQSTSESLRRDSEGFLIPDIPIDRALLEASNIAHSELIASENAGTSTGKQARKRRKKEKKAPIAIPEEDLEIENDLEEEIENILDDGEIDEVAVLARAEALATRLRGPSTVSNEEDLDDAEFDDDPEVARCVLSAEEVALKEKIWVTKNEDWLRDRQAKMLKKSLEQASGGPKKKQQRRKHAQMGDGSVLGGTPASSPAEAVGKMLNQRTKGFSKFVNYENLKRLYGGDVVSSGDSSDTTSPKRDAAPSPSSQWVTKPTKAPSASKGSPEEVVEVVEDVEDEDEEDEDDEDEEMEDEEEAAERDVFSHFEEEYGYDEGDEEY
ncbi:uncharacterized protein BDZ99DRAFT_566949 [Mytilinidion resinicola]|uniref:B-related factor 1 n=1 Tax=Mytilinidion resinicola TaxID=574789 RepID=A0A6A6Z469_9PEZI|nr:uncharacterized protein BDZ99DRAFT_566949 [Mytilinidion resinicola]KAF2815047.1 hypothetical protein BDZ99DRAFT_566949 [Mytilinidion resinicola]